MSLMATVVAAAGLLPWVLALGGLAAATSYCSDPGADARTCWNFYGFSWWALFFALFVFIAVILLNLLNKLHLPRPNQSTTGFLLMSCVANMVAANQMSSHHTVGTSSSSSSIPGLSSSYEGSGDTSSKVASAVDAATAGFSLLVVVQFVLVVCLAGMEPAVSASAAKVKGPAPPPLPADKEELPPPNMPV